MTEKNINLKISNYYLFITYCAPIVAYVADMCNDIFDAFNYYLDDNVTYCWLTSGLMLLTAFLNTLLSLQIYSHNIGRCNAEEPKTNKITKLNFSFTVIFQLAPLLRIYDAFRYARQSRDAEKRGDLVLQRKYFTLMLLENANIAILKLFDTFLESAPQIVLQVANLLSNNKKLQAYQWVTTCLSTLFMGLMLMSYDHDMRYTQQNKDIIDWKGTTFQVLWHFCVSLSRVTCLSVLLLLFPFQMLLACLVHALLMALWINLRDQIDDQQKNFLKTDFQKIAFSLTMGFVFVFTYILKKDTHTRYRHALYFGISVMENVSCGVIWYTYGSVFRENTWLFYTILGLCEIPLMLGMIFMILYYLLFHPNAKLKKAKDSSCEAVDLLLQ